MMREEWKREVERSAEEILRALSKSLEILTGEEETYYLGEPGQSFREDGAPSSPEEREEFRKRFLKVVPSKDEEGNVRAEAAGWVR